MTDINNNLIFHGSSFKTKIVDVQTEQRIVSWGTETAFKSSLIVSSRPPGLEDHKHWWEGVEVRAVFACGGGVGPGDGMGKLSGVIGHAQKLLYFPKVSALHRSKMMCFVLTTVELLVNVKL